LPKRITLVLAVVLGVGVAVEFGSASFASATSTQKFCAALSADGGSTPFAQAATSGQGATSLVAPLQKLGKAAPSKSLKSSLSTLATLFKRIGGSQNVSGLGSKNVASLDKAMASFSAYVVKNCPSTSSPSTTAAATGGLSGTWSGQYSGASQGTFTLTWQQSGSDLTGTIIISDFGAAPININGTVTGSTIRFGTVGSQAITYSGSVSANSMSGTYTAPTGTGNWNATKAS
jgi:hypothetical protein